jgi:glycosyltransferase involved in cell wall biosynthesis
LKKEEFFLKVLRKVKVSVLVPGYNEAENIEPLLKEAKEFFEKEKLSDWEIVYIDDGSTDNTLEMITPFLKKYKWLKFVSYKRNMGKTYALIRGAEVAEGGIFVIFDADLQFTFDDAKRLVDKIEEGYDIVCGRKEGRYQKRFVSFVYNNMTRLLFNVPATDMNSMKAFKREVFENVPLRKDWHRYIVVWGWEYGFSVTEIPVKLRPRLYGKSKYKGLKRILIGVLDLIAVKAHISFMRKPMLLFGSLGLFFFVTGIISTIISLYMKYFLDFRFRLASIMFMMILFFILGSSLFALGFLAETVAGIYDKIEKLERKER